MLLRALQENRRLEVLSRPQIMALDGQLGQVQVGQDVPTITAVSLNEFGQTNSIFYRPVGLILQVLPRISPDGLVVMQIRANKSEVGAEAEGIPISITNAGQILRAPRIENTDAITTVSALSGQTVVLSGLLTTRKFDVHRSVPLISDIPLIGDLFRYDLVSEERRELLIILTPQIVYDRRDSERLKQVESSRMSWILADVISINGPSGLRSRCDEWFDFETETVYPNCVPSANEMPSANGQMAPYIDGEPLPAETGPMEMIPAMPTPTENQPGAPPRVSPPVPAPVAPPTSDRYAPALVAPASYGATMRLPQTTTSQ
jgi:hypothetical protein